MTYRNFTEAERKAIGFMGNKAMDWVEVKDGIGLAGMEGRTLMGGLYDKGVLKREYDKFRVKVPWRIFNPDGSRRD